MSLFDMTPIIMPASLTRPVWGVAGIADDPGAA
jgi:hypothetical protein